MQRPGELFFARAKSAGCSGFTHFLVMLAPPGISLGVSRRAASSFCDFWRTLWRAHLSAFSIACQAPAAIQARIRVRARRVRNPVERSGRQRLPEVCAKCCANLSFHRL